MRFASIRSLDISNGLGIGVALFTQGCPFHCKGCFNPETWDFDGGKEFTNFYKTQILELIQKPYIKRFSLLGGEGLVPQNRYEIATLIQSIKTKRPDIKIWIYTGYTLEELLEQKESGSYMTNILDNIDILVDGQFIEEQKDISLPFCGSRNQRIIDIPATMNSNSIVLLDI